MTTNRRAHINGGRVAPPDPPGIRGTAGVDQQGVRPEVFPVIGLEVHAQLQTRSKLFCSCPLTVGAPANSATCPVCLGFPGTLPVANRHAVTLAVKLAAAVGGEIHRDSRFARKNYFYPDLPKGYQISQYDRPIATGGSIEIDTPAGTKTIRLVRIHMEEDAGKLLHDTPYDDVPPTVSLVDWNRCGVALVEIVSEPDLRSPEEASAYLTELRRLLRYTGVSDADMEKGNMRCDANVSVRASADADFGTRVEIKNLNSIRYVARAIEHEIERQAEAIERGERIVMETRLWDVAAGRTVSMRGKEEAHDYRYFPEPDLGALIVDEAWIAEAASELPELPRARQSRFVSQYGLSRPDAETLTSARELADYFEELARLAPDRAGAARQAARAPGGEGDLQRLGQGGLRGDARLARRGPGDRRGEGAREDERRVGARNGRGRDRLGEPGAGRAVPLGQDADLRVVRRAGHEEDRRARGSRGGP
jgi:aspartyl-tRNA(Asn)/glutamyl-tRNA(Gln) amidotransferase subunit B